jgi:anthranilate phosphoribosyltransferase
MRDEATSARARTGWPPAQAARGRGGANGLSAMLPRLLRGENLGRGGAARLLDALLDAEATDAQIGAALVALAAKGETVEELTGMAEAMR